MNSSNIENLTSKLRLISESHRYDLIEEHARQLLAADPGNGYAHSEILRAYNNTRQHEKLYNACYEALRYDPNQPFPYYYLYLYHLSIGGDSYKLAKEMIEKALLLKPDNAVYHRELGELFLINRDAVSAERVLSAAVSLNPSNAEYRSRHALALLRCQKAELAFRLADKALSDDPGDYQVLNNVGMIYLQGGKLEKAEKLFRSALAKFPTYEYFQKQLKTCLQEQADEKSRQKAGKKYTPLYKRLRGGKRFFE